jgi:hypothetical protein
MPAVSANLAAVLVWNDVVAITVAHAVIAPWAERATVEIETHEGAMTAVRQPLPGAQHLFDVSTGERRLVASGAFRLRFRIDLQSGSVEEGDRVARHVVAGCVVETRRDDLCQARPRVAVATVGLG